MAAVYNLYSLKADDPNVGIWYLDRALIGQPVRLAVDLIEWRASPPIRGGGPTRLSAGPYQYTRERDAEVFATNEPEAGQEWFLIPRNREDAYLIAADPEGRRVWTAEEPQSPIRIQEVTGERNQLFRFVQIVNRE